MVTEIVRLSSRYNSHANACEKKQCTISGSGSFYSEYEFLSISCCNPLSLIMACAAYVMMVYWKQGIIFSGIASSVGNAGSPSTSYLRTISISLSWLQLLDPTLVGLSSLKCLQLPLGTFGSKGMLLYLTMLHLLLGLGPFLLRETSSFLQNEGWS